MYGKPADLLYKLRIPMAAVVASRLPAALRMIGAVAITAVRLGLAGIASRGRRGLDLASRHTRLLVAGTAAGLALLGIAAVLSVAALDSDSGRDAATVLRNVGSDLSKLRWQFGIVVVVFGAAHYFATAIGARAASGLPTPLGETVMVQLAAAAANRITPVGSGGAAVNARYFTRRGMDGPGAVGAVTALAVLGGVADLAVMGLIVGGGRWLGLGGGSGEAELLARHVSRLLAPARSPLLWPILGVAALVLLVLARTGRLRPIRWRRFARPVMELGNQPRRLATLIVASGSTTLLLGLAFAASVAMVPGPQPTEKLGALLIGFMLAAAAGGVVPTPAGIGATEAAFVAVLVAARVPMIHAVEQVVIFRLMTFWLPAAVGVLATGWLRSRKAL
jgi:uncharacterized membrane protein YbhN (UPF0104 family)